MKPRPRYVAALALAALALVAVRADAQTCTEYRITYDGQNHTSWNWSLAAAGAEAVSILNSGAPIGCTGGTLDYEWRFDGQIGPTLVQFTRTPVGTCTNMPSATTISRTFGTRNTNACPPPCSRAAGTKFPADVSGMSSQTANSIGCASGCVSIISGPTRTILTSSGYRPVATMESLGQACGGQTPVNESSCQAGASGTLCLDHGKNCGTVNGDRVCPQSITSGCVAYASGGVACVVSGPGAVPASQLPNNGNTTPSPATPTAVVESGGKTVNYYNRTTVSSSTTPVNTNGTGSAGQPTGEESSGSSGGGAGTVNSEGEDTADGQCEGTECEGTDAGIPQLEELQTFQQITQAYWESMSNAPIVAAVDSIGTALPAGACPTFDVSLPYINYSGTLDIGCGIYTDLAPILSAVMLAVWSIGAIVIVLRA